MVYFTCQHCGESINKPKVEMHYATKCRFKKPNLTCADCLKDFHDQEYNSHTQCITEAERYSAKGTISKQPTGQKKQERYILIIQSLLSSKNLTSVQRELLKVCASFENVPRKFKKFQNFMKCVARNVRHTKKDEENVFQLIESAWKSELQNQTNIKMSQETQNSEKTPIDGNSEISNNCKSTEDVKISSNSNESNSISNNIPKPKKTKNKQSNELNTTVEEKMQIECNSISGESKENINGLTKKQLKKQKKYEKYHMELQKVRDEQLQDEEISSSDEGLKKSKKKSKRLENGLNNLNAESGKTIEVVEERKQKKSKKHNMHSVNEQTDEVSAEITKEDSQENCIEDNIKNKKKQKKSKRQQTNPELNGNSIENTTSEINNKKNKKRKIEEELIETTEERKKARITEDVDDDGTQTTFDWTNVILRVLESRPDKELSIKKLGKKVINEYQTVKPDHRTYEDLLAKFNKKVNKTKGVRVLKDKAKLVE